MDTVESFSANEELSRYRKILEMVAEMRRIQKLRDKTLNWGWRCKALSLEAEVDKVLAENVGYQV